MLHPKYTAVGLLLYLKLVALMVVAGLTVSTECRAAASVVTGPTALSGSTPFPQCVVPGEQTPDSEAEPTIAVNPADPDDIIVSWQQDRFAIDGGAVSNVVAVSKDGGDTWRQVLMPNLTQCTAESGKSADERASDPWLSIGPDGRAYLASLTFSETPINPYVAGPTKLVVSTSSDGGSSWSDPVDVQPFDATYNDREAITADPTRPGTAYYVFVKRYGAFGESGIEMFSRTTDGGEHWSLPLPIFVPPPLTLTDPTLINVLLDGTLLNFVLVANLSPFLPEPVPRVPWFIMATRSRDQGLTWSLPAVIAEISPGAPVADGEIVRAYNLISTAVDLVDGTAYVAWNEIGPMSSSIRLSRSSDGGATWSAPEVVRDGTAQAFIPSVAVSGDGTVAVTYDDFRNDSSGDDGVTTDIWFSYLPKNGTEWKEIHLAGPFDTLTAPETESSGVAGLFVGDYQGLVGLPGGDFAAIFAQAEPQATAGPSDVFFARIHTDTTD